MQQFPTILAGDRISASLLMSMEPQSIVKSADESRTSTAAVSNDTEFFFACEANALYLLEGYLKYSGATAGDINIDWTAPAGSTGEWFAIGIANDTAATANGYLVQMATQDIEAQRSFGTITGVNYGLSLNGTLRTSSTAGTYQMQWAQLTSNATATIIAADSWMKLTRVA